MLCYAVVQCVSSVGHVFVPYSVKIAKDAAVVAMEFEQEFD